MKKDLFPKKTFDKHIYQNKSCKVEVCTKIVQLKFLKEEIMKRTIITVLLVLSLTFLIALESDPSETVGFVKITAGMGYTPFALPFTFYDATHTETHLVSDIIGDQVTGGTPTTSDRIIDVNTGQFAFYNSGTSTWAGTLSNMDASHAFYIQVKNTALDLYLAGTVEDVTVDYGTLAVGYNAVGIQSASELLVSELNLVESGFTGGTPTTSDRIIDVNTGQFAFYNSGTGTFAGTLANITPGHVYYVQVKNTAFNWIFNPAPPRESLFKQTKKTKVLKN